MKVIEFVPYVLGAIVADGGEMTAGDLSEAVLGASGRNNSKLTKTLFPYMVSRGLLKVREKGRRKFYSIGPNAVPTAS